ncbi:hypothetical protein [Citrobacter farmeri]|uniref:Uncharacterized protein n=1 Tax=Citrobacter farmeri TaxID=67824 RepID=A0A8H9NWK6_9ENTR|nr:hypothetical protein [Citrobacter farmeri]MBU5646674.1 hypothetical protein [Pluralibacter sp. S54_ASV_43]HAT2166917.1 hypothetical protein [Citrobacter freundii]HAT3754378.1 hypothetical protein [Citrobacter amalonaticus]EHK0943310.1 hypothetical protein [Citrobacter farmeri]EKV7299565.1 hypothetical protein [Citrobacter farmeri]
MEMFCYTKWPVRHH